MTTFRTTELTFSETESEEESEEEKDIWVTDLGDTVMGDNFDYVFQSCNELLEISSSENNGVITLTFCINQYSTNNFQKSLKCSCISYSPFTIS